MAGHKSGFLKLMDTYQWAKNEDLRVAFLTLSTLFDNMSIIYIASLNSLQKPLPIPTNPFYIIPNSFNKYHFRCPHFYKYRIF